ncbi:MAG: sigma-E factor regulatory protein RseB domain-containing protein [Candidatus Hinthialibacter sp.]
MTQRCFLLFSFICLIFLAGHEYAACAAENLADLLKESMEVSKQIPCEGVLSFCRKTPSPEDEDRCSKVKFCRTSPDREWMEVIQPDLLKNHIVARIDDVIWMSPISEEVKKKLPYDLRFHHWYRVFRDVTGIIDLKHYDLLVENYDLTLEGFGSAANRKASIIYIHTKWAGRRIKRPSLRLWIDQKTSMPLKCDQIDYDGRLKESVQFESIQFGRDAVPCDIQTEGLEKIPPPPKRGEEKDEPKLDFTPFVPKRMLRGYKEVASNVFRWKEHIVFETNYSDGLSTFSTYQRLQTQEEKEAQAQEAEEERDKVKKYKGREIYYRESGGVQIVGVGDIDPCAMSYFLSNMTKSDDR